MLLKHKDGVFSSVWLLFSNRAWIKSRYSWSEMPVATKGFSSLSQSPHVRLYQLPLLASSILAVLRLLPCLCCRLSFWKWCAGWKGRLCEHGPVLTHAREVARAYLARSVWSQRLWLVPRVSVRGPGIMLAALGGWGPLIVGRSELPFLLCRSSAGLQAVGYLGRAHHHRLERNWMQDSLFIFNVFMSLVKWSNSRGLPRVQSSRLTTIFCSSWILAHLDLLYAISVCFQLLVFYLRKTILTCNLQFF